MRSLLCLIVQMSCFTFGVGFTMAETHRSNGIRPNVILIMTDDQGWGTFDCMAGWPEWVRTWG